MILELTYTRLYNIIKLRKTKMKENIIETINTKIKIYRKYGKYELYC